MFEKELQGLKALHDTGTIDTPAPIASGESGEYIFLVMESITPGKPRKDFWKVFAHGMAALHKNSASYFGFAENNYIGSLPQDNTPTGDWADFYAERRIMPLMQAARSAGKCNASDARKAEKLCSRLNRLFPVEPPSLLHGDLWAGNFMVNGKGDPVIFDPAVYYGHREIDLAMTLLFGGFDKTFYEHYNEAFLLENGWRQRIRLCQLYPLLVHLHLFGGHYYDQAMQVITEYL